jgi:ribosomal-protein-alanine N-acetyltransferase
LSRAAAILTPRLALVPFNAALARAQLENRASFFKRLRVRAREDWPPPLYDDRAIDWVKNRIEEGLDPAWLVRVVVTRAWRPGRARAVGVAGFKGPPDENGEVEIGYSIVPSEQRKGYCTEAVAALLDFAWSDPRVAFVSAHTLDKEETEASRKVLERAGFSGPKKTEENFVVRYEKPRITPANRSACESQPASRG